MIHMEIDDTLIFFEGLKMLTHAYPCPFFSKHVALRIRSHPGLQITLVVVGDYPIPCGTIVTLLAQNRTQNCGKKICFHMFSMYRKSSSFF